ncbi:hypothetical protein GCM10022243_46430 [Saccharothrix violaceirubra]
MWVTGRPRQGPGGSGSRVSDPAQYFRARKGSLLDKGVVERKSSLESARRRMQHGFGE